jgi:hypothetical protein
MIKTVKEDRVLLTPEVAKQHATMTPMPGERPFKQARMNALRKLYEGGKFKSMLWAKGTERGQTEEWRINGQHSSKMFAALAQDEPEQFPKDLYATVWEYTWDRAEERADVFAMFDNRISQRDTVDTMGIHLAQYPDLNVAGITAVLVVDLTKGLNAYYAGNDRARRLTVYERGVYLADPKHREFIRWALEFADGTAGWLLNKTGIVAQMFDDFVNRDREVIGKFWGYVFNQNHPNRDHETHTMVAVFVNWRDARGTKSQMDWRTKAAAASRRFAKEYAQSGDPGTADSDDDEDAADSPSATTRPEAAILTRSHRLTEDDLE